MIRAITGSLLLLAGAVAGGCEAYVLDGDLSGDAGGARSDDGAFGDRQVQDTCAIFYADFEPVESVSFRDDLVPILQQNCNANICHGGDYEQAQAGLWLGPNSEREPTEDELWFVYRSLVDIQSTVAPQFALVRRGSAADSYLMRKLDDCYDLEGLDCVLDPDLYRNPCGDSMPVLAAQLPGADRDRIRSWIENGAPEN